MRKHMAVARKQRLRAMFRIGAIVLLAALGGRPVGATTYVSAEPIPSEAIVGSANLAAIEGIGYANKALWAQRLLDDCRVVASVIHTLSAHGVTTTISPVNTHYLVAAGGFEGVTDPTYVFTIHDRGAGAASAADIFALDNALGYALNQGGTAQFGLAYDPANPYEFGLPYAVVTLAGSLTGQQAQTFFNYLGTIDPALWSGTDAGFTQIKLPRAAENDSLLFLIGAVSKSEFRRGLYHAARTTPGATYSPLGTGGEPRTATAGAAFLGNGWATPGGGYLENLPASHRLRTALEGLRQRHLQDVNNLLAAINQGTVATYLSQPLSCP